MDKILRRRLATKQISTGLSVWQIHKFGHLCSFCWKVIRHFFPSFPQFAACVLLAGPGPGFLSQFSYHCHCNYSDESRSRQPTLDNSSREEIVQMFHLASGSVLRYFWWWLCHRCTFSIWFSLLFDTNILFCNQLDILKKSRCIKNLITNSYIISS